MSETVLILGAGASHEAGGPLMNDLLDVADELRKKGKIQHRDEVDLVFRAVSELQAVLSKAQLDLMNFESVFATFEMAKLLGRLGTLSVQEIERLPIAMSRLIEETLENTILMPIKNSQITPPIGYDQMLKSIVQIAEKQSGDWRGLDKVSIITFNYDLCLDVACHYHSVPIHYGLETESGSPCLRIYKHHGSLNWIKCSKCNSVAAWNLRSFMRNRSWNSFSTSKTAYFRVASNLRQFSHCPDTPGDIPFLVPPTWNKAEHHSTVGRVWRAAAKALSDAENILVYGYSLPPADHFFRTFYALGSVGSTRLKKFWVYDPDDKVKNRFSALLGPTATARFQFVPLNFCAAIERLGHEVFKT